MKHVLKLRTYKVPFTKNAQGEIVEDNSVPLTKREMLTEKEVEIESISVELIPISQQVSQFNARQVKYAKLGTDKDYILKRIITK